MRISFYLLITIILFNSCAFKAPSNSITTELATNKRIDSIMANMELIDKVGEMTQYAIDVLSKGEPYNLEEPHKLDMEKMRHVLVEQRVGSILNVGGHAYTRDHWYEIMGAIQDMATREKPTGIPVLYGIDAIHGTNYTVGATLFPQQIGLAATWNTDLAFEMGEVTAYETRASTIPWTFSPVLDMGRDPRWPRFWETFGEDVYLASEMGVATVHGYEGNNVADREHIAACLKHFLGYSQPLSGHDRSQAWIPDRQLREYFLPTFQHAIEAGAKTIMICSGEINGIPVHANSDILTDLLKNELNFQGFAVTDWEDIGYLHSRHRIATSFKEAIGMAINAGVDMAMVPMDTDFPVLLKELVEEGVVPMSRINDAVRRILRVKIELGLFEKPYYPKESYAKFGSDEFAEKAYQSAAESITLLKNENRLLPLAEGSRILVTGPTAHSLNYLNGGWTWTWQGSDTTWNPEDKLTILEALKARMGENQVVYEPGCTIDSLLDLNSAVRAARNSDVIILCLGEETYTEFVGNINDLNLPGAQYDLAKAMAETGKPVVTVLIQGRPRIIEPVEPVSDAIIMGYLPGNEGGRALVDILFGDINPSGKLPFTYPQHVSSFMTYDHKYFDRLDKESGFTGFDPQFEFGHGLSYTSFAYSNLSLDQEILTEADSLLISVLVKNTGEIPGKEVVQLYVTDEVASIAPPVKRLRGFQKIQLKPGETRKVSFSLTVDDLAFVGRKNKWVTEPGFFTITVNNLESRFEYKTTSL